MPDVISYNAVWRVECGSRDKWPGCRIYCLKTLLRQHIAQPVWLIPAFVVRLFGGFFLAYQPRLRNVK